METLVNCDRIVDIISIDQVLLLEQQCEIYITTGARERYKIRFDQVWDFRKTMENAFIKRASQFLRGEREKVAFF